MMANGTMSIVLGKYNRPFVIACFLILCLVGVVWGGTYTMAVLAIAAQPVNNYCQIKGRNGGTEVLREAKEPS